MAATFSEGMDASSITGQSFKLFKKGSTTKIAAAAPTYDAATRTSTYAALAPGTSHDIPYPSTPQAGEVIFLFLSNLSNPELLEMADEGLVLAARAKARLGHSLSAAQHTEGHLQVVGVGEWRPASTCPAWNAEPRLPPGQEDT